MNFVETELVSSVLMSVKLQRTGCVAVCVGLSGLATPTTGLPLYGCCRLPYSPSTSSMRSVFDRLHAQLSPGLLHLQSGFGAGFERSPVDGLGAGFRLDLTSVAARTTPGLGVRRIPPTMLLCPTPQYAVTVDGSVASAPADVALDYDDSRTAAAGSGSVNWMLAKSSSIAELRLKAQQYAAMLYMR